MIFSRTPDFIVYNGHRAQIVKVHGKWMIDVFDKGRIFSPFRTKRSTKKVFCLLTDREIMMREN